MESLRANQTNFYSVPILRFAISCLILLILSFLAETVKAQTPKLAGSGTYKVLYTFTGGSDGANPYGGVILDKAGNLYGTTYSGGVFGSGTVFKLTPSGSGWTETVLYSFTGGSDGANPSAGVILDPAGNIYGNTFSSGDPYCWCGTVFRLTPSADGWTQTTLYTFHYSDGAHPGGGLVGLVGTTTGGGRGFGTAFVLYPSGSTWNAHVYPFSGSNGAEPWSTLIWDGFSYYYGTTYSGGSSGSGKVFDLRMNWLQKIHDIYTFSPTGKAGSHPVGGLVLDHSGNLYGTTYNGPGLNRGSIFQLTPDPIISDKWFMHVLYSFSQSGVDGSGPAASMVLDTAGNLFGTTAHGGADPGYDGTLFQLSPGKPGKTWTLTVLHSFSGGSDGGEIYSGVVLDDAGNMYGTANRGGAFDAGVVYQYTPGTTTTVVSDRNPSVLGDTVTFTATVSVNAPRTGIPSGTVMFLDGVTEMGSRVLDNAGHAELATAALPEGIHSITATYQGDTAFQPSTSSVLKQQVGIPAATLSTGTLSFGTIINTTSAPKSVTLTNTGSAPLSISSISAASPFAIFSTTCGPSLMVNANCKIYVTFSPTVLGKRGGTLVVIDNAPNSPQTVALSGIGLLPVALTPTVRTFAGQAVGTTSLPKLSVLTNNLNVTLDNIVISTAGDFSVSANTCTTSLVPKGKCTISVVFTPTSMGTRTGELRVTDTASNSPQTATLMGTGK